MGCKWGGGTNGSSQCGISLCLPIHGARFFGWSCVLFLGKPCCICVCCVLRVLRMWVGNMGSIYPGICLVRYAMRGVSLYPCLRRVFEAAFQAFVRFIEAISWFVEFLGKSNSPPQSGSVLRIRSFSFRHVFRGRHLFGMKIYAKYDGYCKG